MIDQLKRKFNSLYWHQFALTASMVMLTLLLLGISFFTLSYGTTTADKRGEMRTRAELIAQVSADYFTAAGDTGIDQAAALRKLADMASRMTDVDFLICSTQGNVLLTTDNDLVGRSIMIPQEIVDDIQSDKALYQGRSNVNGTYSAKKFAVAVPVKSDGGQLLGIVACAGGNGRVGDHAGVALVYRIVPDDLRHHSADCLSGKLRYLHAADPTHYRHGKGHTRLCRR